MLVNEKATSYLNLRIEGIRSPTPLLPDYTSSFGLMLELRG